MSDDGLQQPLGDLVGWFCAATRVDDEAVLGHPAVTSLALDLPVELSVRPGTDGRLTVLASPPTQRIATTVLPVFHRMRLRIEREEVPDG